MKCVPRASRAFFLDVFESAELREGATTRFDGTHARCNVVGGLLLDVEAQFGVELVVESAFAK